MGIFHKSTSRPAAVPTVTSQFLSKSTGFRLVGAFAFIGTAATLTLTTHATSPGSTSLQANAASQQGQSVPVLSTSSTAPSVQSFVDSDSSSLNTSTNSAGTTTQVTVNGQNVPVPANGSTQQNVTSSSGDQATVNISHTSSSEGSNSSTSTLQINSTSVNSSGGSTSVNINNTSTEP